MPIDHEVKAGECIASIAKSYGFFPDTLWNDSANTKLKELRKDGYCLLPDDIVVVMDKRVGSVAAAAGQRHSFTRKGVPEKLVVRITSFKEGAHCPKANAKFTFYLDDVSRTDRETDSDGMIEEFIPPETVRAKAVFEDGETFEFELGDLDPIDSISGVHARLTNLGVDCGPPAETMTEGLEAGIRAYQEALTLPVNGLHDDAAFVARLEEDYENGPSHFEE
jgi:hypothetical protein